MCLRQVGDMDKERKKQLCRQAIKDIEDKKSHHGTNSKNGECHQPAEEDEKVD